MKTTKLRNYTKLLTHKDDQGAIFTLYVGQGIGFSIDTGQAETGRFPTKITNRGLNSHVVSPCLVAELIAMVNRSLIKIGNCGGMVNRSSR